MQQDPEEYYYIYAQTMEGRTQYGLAMCCHFEDYLSGAIKKHELTRPDKEEDRMIHVRNQQANIEPVFFAYPDNAEIDAIVAGVVSSSAPGVRLHRGRRFPDIVCGSSATARPTTASPRFSRAFPRSTSPTDIISTAAAARVGAECKAKNPGHCGEEEYCYFLAVTFPAGQLRIIDYNRVVKGFERSHARPARR